MEFEIRDLRKKEKFVVDDAYLNGYAKKCGIYATGIYISLCRHADKEQKCWPSHKKIAKELNISIASVIRGFEKLLEYKIIHKERLGKKLNNRYWLLDKSEWSHGNISEVSHSNINSIPQQHHELLTDTSIVRKHIIKETHSKDIATPSVAEIKPNINLLIEKFKEVNPAYEQLYKNKNQRAALERMIKVRGLNEVSAVIEILPKTNKEKYMPVITTPYQLEEKYGQLMAHWERLKKEHTCIYSAEELELVKNLSTKK